VVTEEIRGSIYVTIRRNNSVNRRMRTVDGGTLTGYRHSLSAIVDGGTLTGYRHSLSAISGYFKTVLTKTILNILGF
jgi:hypothetical protein